MATTFYRQYGKRLFDIAVAASALIVFSPLLLVTSILIRFRLGSPIVFRQDRPGLGGRIFRIAKFRSMNDARDESGKLLEDHFRLTAFGKFLRASSIDELPELWNVLIGQMSLVGPRPLRTHYLPLYSKRQARRHEVRPGITGWAQVNGRNGLSWEDRFKLDVWYVENSSFLLDLKILFMTVAAVFRRENITPENAARMPDFEGTKKQTVIVGLGGCCEAIATCMNLNGIAVDAIYDDDQESIGKERFGLPVAGPISELALDPELFDGVISSDDAAIRRKLGESIPMNWLSVVHPTANVAPTAVLGQGTVVLAGSKIGANARLGDHALILADTAVNAGDSVPSHHVVWDVSQLQKLGTVLLRRAA